MKSRTLTTALLVATFFGYPADDYAGPKTAPEGSKTQEKVRVETQQKKFQSPYGHYITDVRPWDHGWTYLTPNENLLVDKPWERGADNFVCPIGLFTTTWWDTFSSLEEDLLRETIKFKTGYEDIILDEYPGATFHRKFSKPRVIQIDGQPAWYEDFTTNVVTKKETLHYMTHTAVVQEGGKSYAFGMNYRTKPTKEEKGSNFSFENYYRQGTAASEKLFNDYIQSFHFLNTLPTPAKK